MDKIKQFFLVNSSYKAIKYTLLVSLIIGILAYNVFIIYGYTNPDGIIEGLTSYINAGWHIEGCGRWLIPIILSTSANIHMPLISILLFCLLTGLSVFIICKLWNETEIINCVLITSVMCVTHTTIIHVLYNTVLVPYAFACLFAIIYVYAIFKIDNIWSYVISIFFLTCSMAIFQAYIGLAACLILFTTIIYLLNNRKEIFKYLIKAIICALISAILYWLSLKVIFAVLHLESTSRIAGISLIDALKNIVPSTIKAYKAYFNDFNDSLLHKNIIYILILILFIISLVTQLIKKDYITVIIVIACVLLIPLASNVVCLILYNQETSVNMAYQNIILIPFTVYLSGLSNKYIKNSTIVITTILIWLNIVSANATFTCFKLSYNAINKQTNIIMNDIIHNENYVINETPVIFVGYPSDETLRKNIKTYKYAYGFENEGNIVFWNNQQISVTYNRQKYIMNYFGIDVKDLDYSQYQDVVNTNEFKKMPTWPSQESIKLINNILVVKLSEDNIK